MNPRSRNLKGRHPKKNPAVLADEGRRLAGPGDGCGEIDEVCRRSREKRAVGDEQKILGAVGAAAGHSHDFDRHSARVTVEIVSYLERIRETHPGVILARTREQSLGEESLVLFEVTDFESRRHASVVLGMGVAPRGLRR